MNDTSIYDLKTKSDHQNQSLGKLQDFEKCLAGQNIDGASKALDYLYNHWDALSIDQRQRVAELEPLYQIMALSIYRQMSIMRSFYAASLSA